MEFLKNTWFVGISTGLISGIIVFFLTKWIMDKKGRTEYYKQVKAANSAVINALKPYISDKGLPDIEIFKALISANARYFGVSEEDMYSVDVYCEELIREIISDVYVSNEKKQEYTELLAKYKKSIVHQKEKVIELVETHKISSVYSERISSRMSMYVAVLTGLIALLSSLMIEVEDNVFLNSPIFSFEDSTFTLMILLFLLTVSVLLVILVTSEGLLKIIKKRRPESDSKDSEIK